MLIYVRIFIQNGQYSLNYERKFVNKYKPHYHDEVLVELLYDVNDLILPDVRLSVISI